jgi:hypothetical protein
MWIVRLLQPARRRLQRLALRLGRHERVHGVPLVDWVIFDETQAGFAEVRAALELVWRYDRRRFRRMLRDVDYVIVTNTAGTAGEHWRDIRSMLIDAGCAIRQVREATAMTIVHEATHARLWTRGVGRFPDRARIEAACIRAEIEFVRKIPGAERLIVGSRMKLDSRYWEASRRDEVVVLVTRFGWPRWLRRLLGYRSTAEMNGSTESG